MDTVEQQKATALSVMDSDFSCETPWESMWADLEAVALRALVTLHQAMLCHAC